MSEKKNTWLYLKPKFFDRQAQNGRPNRIIEIG